MAIDIQRTLDFGNGRRIINLPDGVGAQEPATVAQLNSAIEGLASKDSCRVATQANINLAAPGATIDGITMASGDRFVARAQTAAAENGIYVWNGASTPATRALDANTANELEQAITTIEEGTSAGVTYRQTAVNFTLGSGSVTWVTFGTSAGAASETSAGIAELATQSETDAGTDDLRIVTPLKLASSPWARKVYQANIGDGSATSYAVTHNLGTRDVSVELYRNSGNYDTVLAEVQRTTTNQITILFDTAPALNAYRAVVRA